MNCASNTFPSYLVVKAGREGGREGGREEVLFNIKLRNSQRLFCRLVCFRFACLGSSFGVSLKSTACARACAALLVRCPRHGLSVITCRHVDCGGICACAVRV